MKTALRAAAAVAILAVPASALPADEVPLSLEDALKEAAEANPQVQAARQQYEAARHQIEQSYAPSDPQLGVQLSQTPNGLTRAQTRSVGISDSFQFPGKALLQGGAARRNAEIARLVYLAAARDARAQAQTAYYQTLLDSASVEIARENLASFSEVLAVAEVAYTANQVSQTDLISAQFGVSQASQSVLAGQVAESNDEAALNQALGRSPDAPLRLSGAVDLKPLEQPLDSVKEKALALRQEMLEAALSEKNAETAARLAWMELLPDYSVSVFRNNYPPGSINNANPLNAGGQPQSGHDYSTSFGVSLPVFFWFRQKEDVRAARRLLETARLSRRAVELQTATSVTQLYRSAQLAYRTATLYRDLLVPLAEQNLHVALIAYQGKKIDFTTLANILQSLYNARSTYLTSANQFLAGRVALEQTMGGTLSP